MAMKVTVMKVILIMPTEKVKRRPEKAMRLTVMKIILIMHRQ